MKVLLVDPPYVNPAQKGNQGIGWTPNVGLLALAAFIRPMHEVKIVDANVGMSQTPWADLELTIRREQPDVVGVPSALTMWTIDAMQAAELVKRIDPRIVVVGGGLQFSLAPEACLRMCPALDFIVVGEGELTFLELLNALSSGVDRQHLQQIPGLAFIKENKFVRTAPRPLISKLDSIPMPAWDLVPLDKYAMHLGPATTQPLFSRGCPLSCSFCSETAVWQRRWRMRSPELIATEMELLARRYNKNIFLPGDSSLLMDVNRSEALCEEILHRDLKVFLWFNARADQVIRHRDLMPKLRRAGAIGFLIGMESPHQTNLDSFEKRQTVEQIREAVRIAQAHGMLVFGTFMWGYWNDSEETLKETYRFIDELGVMAVVMLATPVPGVGLGDELWTTGRVQVTDLSLYDFFHPLMPTSTLSIQEIAHLTDHYAARFRPKGSSIWQMFHTLWTGPRHSIIPLMTFLTKATRGQYGTGIRYQTFEELLTLRGWKSEYDYRDFGRYYQPC